MNTQCKTNYNLYVYNVVLHIIYIYYICKYLHICYQSFVICINIVLYNLR